jgi:hypothetical protein
MYNAKNISISKVAEQFSTSYWILVKTYKKVATTATMGVTFNSGFKSDPTELFPSIVLVIAGEKMFPPPNFNLKIVRIQRGGGSWMLLYAVLHCWEGSAGPRLKNVMNMLKFPFLCTRENSYVVVNCIIVRILCWTIVSQEMCKHRQNLGPHVHKDIFGINLCPQYWCAMWCS